MTSYRTVFRVTEFKENLGLVWGTMIAWKMEPFWYPAQQFTNCVSRQEILTVSWREPLRFICDADIYADDIASLNISNVKLAEPIPEEWL